VEDRGVSGYQHPLEALAAGGQRPKDLMGLSTLLDDKRRGRAGEEVTDAGDSDWDDLSSASGGAPAPAAGGSGLAKRTLPASPPSMRSAGVAVAAVATPLSDWDAESPAAVKASTGALAADDMSDEDGYGVILTVPALSWLCVLAH
jgi:hypothetical protein